MSTKIKSGGRMPEMDLPLVGGGRAHLGGRRERFQMVIVYRGRH